MHEVEHIYNRWWYLKSLDVSVSSISRCANILQWCTLERELVGKAEGWWQEARNKHLTDLAHQETKFMTVSLDDDP